MVHQETISKYQGSFKELAEDMGNLRYDALADFLHLLANKIARDAQKDQTEDKVKLAQNLNLCAQKLKGAATDIDHAWEICKPFVE